MSRGRDKPDGRWLRISTPTPNQIKYQLSGFERTVKQEIDYWNRGLYFIEIWERLGRQWHWYEQFWFFRGTREWWLKYVPYFWRSGTEFLKFEKRFIREATRGRGTMSEQHFIRMAKSHKAQLNLAAIQGPLLGAVAKGGGAAAYVANVLSKINDISDYQDMIKCGMMEDDYEAACASGSQWCSDGCW